MTAKEYQYQYYLLNRERICERHKLYELNHLEERSRRTAKWAQDNPEACRAKVKRCRNAHSDSYRATQKKWQHANPDKMKAYNKHRKSSHRSLGFIPLNEPFLGSDGHHLDKDRVLYIPKDLHMSVPHDVWTGKGMKQINELATRWLTEDWT